jgi:hypothetical protein
MPHTTDKWSTLIAILAVINGLLAPFLLVAILVVASDKSLLPPSRPPAVPASIIRTVQFGPAEPFFPSLCCIYRGDEQSRSEGLLCALGKKRWNMIHTTNKPIAKLHRAPQPPVTPRGDS